MTALTAFAVVVAYAVSAALLLAAIRLVDRGRRVFAAFTLIACIAALILASLSLPHGPTR